MSIKSEIAKVGNIVGGFRNKINYLIASCVGLTSYPDILIANILVMVSSQEIKLIGSRNNLYRYPTRFKHFTVSQGL